MTRTLLWRRLDLPGHEICTLRVIEDRWQLAGTALLAHERRACRLDYRIDLTSAWMTTAVEIGGRIGDQEVRMSIVADRGRWRLDGVEQSEIEGCLDIDLGFSPSTNLLPIRRLALAVGEKAPVRAAWLKFPELRLELLEQVYERLGETSYRYESAGGRFTRVLEVDDVGFVTSYPGIWEAEPTLLLEQPVRRQQLAAVQGRHLSSLLETRGVEEEEIVEDFRAHRKRRR